MTFRTKGGQANHDCGLVAVAGDAIRKGWRSILVDLPGYVRPPQINGYIPDIYARSGMYELVIEIETRDTVNLSHSKTQAIAFQSWARMSPYRRFQILVV